MPSEQNTDGIVRLSYGEGEGGRYRAFLDMGDGRGRRTLSPIQGFDDQGDAVLDAGRIIEALRDGRFVNMDFRGGQNV